MVGTVKTDGQEPKPGWGMLTLVPNPATGKTRILELPQLGELSNPNQPISDVEVIEYVRTQCGDDAARQVETYLSERGVNMQAAAWREMNPAYFEPHPSAPLLDMANVPPWRGLSTLMSKPSAAHPPIAKVERKKNNAQLAAEKRQSDLRNYLLLVREEQAECLSVKRLASKYRVVESTIKTDLRTLELTTKGTPRAK